MSASALSRLAILLAATTVASACATIPPPQWAAGGVTRSTHPHARAVVLSDTARMTFEDEDGPADGYLLERHLRVKILTPAGRDEARIVVFLDAFTTMEDLWARSIGAPGREQSRSLDVRDVTVRSLAGTSGILYSDARALMFDVPGADVGDVVEVHYTLRSSRAFGLDDWTFDGELPVMYSRFEVVVPLGWEMRWSFARDGELAQLNPQKLVPEEGGPTILRWELKNLPAIEPERMGLTASQLAQRLRVAVARAPRMADEGVFPTWDALGRWYRDLTRGLFAMPRGRGAAAVVGGRRAEAIFEYVRDAIRYVAIHEGIGAVRPHDAREVHRMRYGDCKDMATLLTTMLRKAGITAYPALISTRGRGVFDPELPSVSAFDHMIVAIAKKDGGFLFVDPTSKHHPFGALPFGDTDRPVLVVGDEVQLTRTPAARPEDARVSYRWSLEQAERGLVGLTVEAFGSASVRWRAAARSLSGDEELKRSVARLVGAGVATVDRVLVEPGAAGSADGFVLQAKLRVEGLVERLPDGSKLLAFGQLLDGFGEVRVPAERRSPVVLGQPEIVEETVILPAGVEPPDVDGRELKTPVGSYRIKVARTPDGLATLQRRLTWQVDVAPPGHLSHVRALAERIGRDVRLGALIAPPPPPKPPTPPTPPAVVPVPGAGGEVSP